MASYFAAKLKTSKIIILFLAIVSAFAEAQLEQFQTTKMSFYFQIFSDGPKATVAKVAGIPGQLWDSFTFGTVLVSDDPLTEGIDLNSTEIGRAQGMSFTCSLDGSRDYNLFSIVFTNQEYNGSTLEIQGVTLQTAPKELSIVSGTGKFRFGRGYANFEILHYDSSRFYTAIRCNITVLHPSLTL